jgi:hypothetical protein
MPLQVEQTSDETMSYDSFYDPIHDTGLIFFGRMVFSGMLRRVALVRTDVSEELGISSQRTSVDSCSLCCS